MAELRNGPEIVTITLPSRLELLGVLDRVAQTLCERMEFDEDVCSQVSMSVIEAGTNAVQHGHKRDPALVFETQFHLHADRLEIYVRDRGPGFDISRIATDVTSPDHLFDMRGRGIFIMRSCMDEVDYSFGEAGTVCHLIKYRPAASRVADA